MNWLRDLASDLTKEGQPEPAPAKAGGGGTPTMKAPAPSKPASAQPSTPQNKKEDEDVVLTRDQFEAIQEQMVQLKTAKYDIEEKKAKISNGQKSFSPRVEDLSSLHIISS